MSSAENKPEDWRIRAEAKRKAALEIRARNEAKRLKEAAGQTDKPKAQAEAVAITPATKAVNPYRVSNPYAKGSSPGKAVNPYVKSSSNKTPTKDTASAHSPAATAVTPKSSQKKVAQVIVASKPPPPRPPITSQWGDCRMDLWEALCTCGAERKAPDVRMCRCLAWINAGLACDGCNSGCLLIQKWTKRIFLGLLDVQEEGMQIYETLRSTS